MTGRSLPRAVAALSGRRDNYYWRVVATGLSFFFFGFGQLVLGLLVRPIARLTGSGTEARHRSRGLVHAAFRLFMEFMRTSGVLTYSFHGVHRLGRPGQLILANHPSLIDVIFLLAFSRSSLCVVKAALWRNPFTRFAVSAAGYISNAPADVMIEAATAALSDGESLVMFPEGTRTTPGTPMHFHRGAANIAVRAATVITPVFIRVQPTTLTKAEPWHRIPNRRPHFSLTVGEDIDPTPYRTGAALPAASRALQEHLLTHFIHHLDAAGRINPDGQYS